MKNDGQILKINEGIRKKEQIGFITLKTEEKGRYSIVNDSKTTPHPEISTTPGHGLAVKEEYRKHGLGSALLSLGVGVAQKHYIEGGGDSQFEVLATDITESGFGCYNNFGFQINEGMTVSEGAYTNSDQVPEIRILRSKASFWGRLKKRLGF